MRTIIKNKESFTIMFNDMFPNHKINNVNGITIDSRDIQQDDIFIPIKGANYNGHDYIASALNSGAQLSFSEIKKNKKDIINVSNTKMAINAIAKKWQTISKAKIIGITGSNGKTTTKELLFMMLSKKYKCSKSIGNYNSSIGLPLTFLSSKIDDDFCILEYGASKPNEIIKLCKCIKPNYSLITNISEAHIENFSSLKEIVKTKSEIYNILEKDDIAFINRDQKNISTLKINSKKITFGYKSKSNYNGSLKIGKNNLLKINNNTFSIPSNIIHLKDSLIATISISLFLNINNDDIQCALNEFTLPLGRGGKVIKNNLEIIDDSYNANPESMKLAIERFNNIKIDGKKIFVMGDMLELGKEELEKHGEISKAINNSSINTFLTYGELSKSTFDNVDDTYIIKKHFYSMNSLKELIKSIYLNGDLIYIKGSRSMKLERIYKG